MNWLIRALGVCAAIIFCYCNSACAQVRGNEWIDYDQRYWKFPVSSDALYKISYQELSNAGFPVNTVDPHLIQVFGRGKECRVKIAGEEDNVFNSGDFIEIYARKNDAWLDSLVYDTPQHVPNPKYSLFNDTATYFITIGIVPGLRTSLSSQSNFTDYVPLSFCTHVSTVEFHQSYLQGKQDINGIGLPTYDEGEGWFDTFFPMGGSHTALVNTGGVYQGSDAPPAEVKCVSAGASIAVGFPNHHLQVGYGNPFQMVYDTTYYGYRLNHVRFQIPAAQLSEGQTSIQHRSVDDLDVASDYHAVSYVEIAYPHSFDFQGVSSIYFSVSNPLNESYLRIDVTNFNGSSPRLFVLDDDIEMEIVTTLNDGVLQAIVPSSGNSRIHLWLVADDQAQIADQINPITQTGFFTDYVSQELDHAFVIITHPALLPAAQNYHAWRNTGEVQSLVANVEELYMQYAYGIYKNPLAIRRFCNDLILSWTTPPDHLFLLGKSIHESNIGSSVGARNDPEKYARNLIPTWGTPGSDALFTAGLNGTLFQHAIPTGRLAAQSTDEVLEYLNKVIEHETQPPAIWQKNILHFGGGTIDYEQNLFRSYLNNYKSIASDTCMGAKVYSFFKNTSDPIQMNVSDSIQLLINQGVSMMTFFGHASSSGFDQNIDLPESYSNQGKYPLLIGNSCYTGNIHLSDAQSASENFVLVPDRGVIGFLAKSDVGVPVYLNLFTENFYREICNLNFGKSIGYCMKKTVEDFQVQNDFYRANTAFNFALHGDPAIKLHSGDLPDYSISASDIFFEPTDVTASQQSFQAHVVVENIGKAINADVGIELIRHYPNGVDSSYVVTADRILNTDTITFQLYNHTDFDAGQNSFDVLVDYPLDLIHELNDASNNVVQGKTLFISSGDLNPVLPFEFEVIDLPQPVLKASTGFAFEPSRTYILQADTTDLFNSPMLATTSITSSGGVVEWTLPFAMTDSMVVFWRCSADSISPLNSYHWRNSSFQYIANQNGWGQQHFYQFRNDAISNLNYETDDRKWIFEPMQAHFKCEVYGASNTTYEALATRYQINLNVLEYGGYGFDSPALMVAVLDSSTFIPWESNYDGQNPQHDYGNTLASANARNRTEKYFIFQQQDAAQLDGFVNMMDAIPDGQYVLVYTWQLAQKFNWENLSPGVSDVFEDIGADAIVAAPDSLPFILFMKKGDPNSLIQVVGSEPSQYIVLETDLVGSSGQGTLRSPHIGPTNNWGSVEWNLNSFENLQGDSTRIRIHGHDWLGSDVLLTDWQQLPDVIPDLGLYVNEAQFPFISMEARIFDQQNFTAPQMDSWHVLYDKVPECAINPNQSFYINSDSLQQGELFELAIAIENISTLDMDSLLIEYKIEDRERNLHSLNYARQAPLLQNEIFIDTLVIDTRDYPGNNRLLVEVNPIDNITHAPDQLEQHHFNNFASIDFYVQEDHINPILDVTFDGLHILNGDIVSTRPNILVTLDDENAFFILNEESDTSHFKLFLTMPDGNTNPVYFSNTDVEWTPATAPTNKFRIDYTPELNTDGKYVLRVQATDKSGNISGDYDYEAQFEIFSKPTITEVLNYPNPFSTRTQFVFTLTGTEPPDQFKIQIMNVGGDIVREITQDELGPMRIGRNLSDYWWDGTDEFGDRLANGVYLYRVLARLNGESMEMNETAASVYFTKGFGKMYLFR